MEEVVVEEAPKMVAPKFIIQIETVETKIGETAKFTCKATGIPSPELIWYKNDKEITKTDKDFKIDYAEDNETSLIIVSVQPDHDDTYTCEATNPAGSDKTKAELFVEGRSSSCSNKLNSVHSKSALFIHPGF